MMIYHALESSRDADRSAKIIYLIEIDDFTSAYPPEAQNLKQLLTDQQCSSDYVRLRTLRLNKCALRAHERYSDG